MNGQRVGFTFGNPRKSINETAQILFVKGFELFYHKLTKRKIIRPTIINNSPAWIW